MIDIKGKSVPHSYRNKYLKNSGGSVSVASGSFNSGANGIATINIITENDNTTFTDSNVLSSLRSLFEIRRRILVQGDYDTDTTDDNFFSSLRTIDEIDAAIIEALRFVSENYLSKVNEDEAKEVITLLKGFIVGNGVASIDADGNTTTINLMVQTLATIYNLDVASVATIFRTIVKDYISSETFIPGFSGEGFKIYQTLSGDWNIEVDNATIRKSMTIFELLISKIRAVNGGLVISPGNGRIKSVSKTNGNPAYYVLGIEGDMTFITGDLVRCQVYTSGSTRNYWVEVKQVDGDSILCLVSDFGSSVPAVGDDLVQFGNTTNVDRQGILYLTASEDGKPRIQVLGGVNSTNLTGKNKAIIGCLDGITDTDFPAEYQPRGYGLYSDNVFLKGLFMLSSGKTVEQDAQEKANAAKGEAIADANGKIDSVKTELSAVPGQITLAVSESKTYADNAVNNIQVGGRNLMLGSAHIGNISVTSTSPYAFVNGGNYFNNLTQQEKYIISFDAKLVNGNGDLHCEFWGSEGDNIKITSSDFARYGVISRYKTQKQLYFWLNNQAGEIQIRNIKFEKGNKPTDWTPAPEDVEADATTKATAAKDAAISDAALKYTTKSEFSTSITQLSDSISFKASQTDVNALSSRVSSAEAKITPDAINLTVKSQTESIANDASLVAKGQMLYRDPTFFYGYNNVNMYNNLGNGTVTVERVSGVAGNPNNSGFCLKIVTKGSSTPGWGGFNFGTSTKANRVLVTRIVANIPVGRRMDWHTNPTGNDSSSKWLTSVDGTGGWSEYVHKLTCGVDGTFQPTAFFALSGGSAPSEASPLEWYVAFATVYDCTGIDDTPTRDEIKAGISITPGVLNIFGNAVNMAGMVTFSSMSADAQTKINTAQSTADTAKQNAASASSAAGAAQTTANSATFALNTLSANALQNKGTIPVADWNTITAMGIYSVPGGTAAQQANFPGGAYPYGQLRVETLGNIVTQTYTTHDLTAVYIRSKYNASDWQPWRQIEDAATSQTRANNARDNVALRLGYANYADMEAKAVAGQTIINGGYIRTSLIKTEEIITSQLLANKISATDITTGRITITNGARIGNFSIIDNSIIYGGGDIRPLEGNHTVISDGSATFSKGFKNINNGRYISGEVNILRNSTALLEVINTPDPSQSYTVAGVALRVSSSGLYDTAIRIEEGYIEGFRMKGRQVSTSQTLLNLDNVIFCTNTATITLTLPTSPLAGHVIFIRKMAAGNITIAIGNSSHKIRNGYNQDVTSVGLTNGSLGIIMWNKANLMWTTNYSSNF